MIEALFILLILQFSNYMPNLQGDKPIPGKFNKYVTSNVYILNVVLLLIIYFSVKGIDDQETNLYIKIRNTFAIWLIYLVYIKLTPTFNVIVFMQFLIIYLLHEYKTHQLHVEHNEYIDEHIDQVTLVMKVIISITMLIGLFMNPPKVKHFDDLLRSI